MVTNNTGNRRLNGLNPLSYLGDNPTTPPNFFSLSRDPTPQDWQDVQLCDLWLNTLTEDVWVLVSLNGNQATWVLLTGGSGSVIELTGNSGGPVFPLAGNINVIANTSNAGASVKFVGNLAPHTLTLNLTDATGSMYVGANSGTNVTSGINNNFFGNGSGASVTSGSANAASGNTTLNALTTGSGNSAFGGGALQMGTTLATNTAVGFLAGQFVLTGANNVLIGAQAGLNYVAAESNNIVIGAFNQGTLGDNNKIRIGVNGSGAGQQNQTFLAGGNVVKPFSSSFNAFLASAVTNKTGDGTTYTLGADALTKSYDSNINFNTNGTFTAPVTGAYNFIVSIVLTSLGAGHTTAAIFLTVSGTSANIYTLADLNPGAVRDASNNLSLGGSINIMMTATDTAVCTIIVAGSTKTVGIFGAAANSSTVISGFLIG